MTPRRALVDLQWPSVLADLLHPTRDLCPFFRSLTPAANLDRCAISRKCADSLASEYRGVPPVEAPFAFDTAMNDKRCFDEKLRRLMCFPACPVFIRRISTSVLRLPWWTRSWRFCWTMRTLPLFPSRHSSQCCFYLFKRLLLATIWGYNFSLDFVHLFLRTNQNLSI